MNLHGSKAQGIMQREERTHKDGEGQKRKRPASAEPCKNCGILQDLKEFYKNNNGSRTRRADCKTCYIKRRQDKAARVRLANFS